MNKRGQYPIEKAVEGEHIAVVYRLVEHYPDIMPSLTELTVKDGVDEEKVGW